MPRSNTGNGSRRSRVVQGTCWTCKRRRVKCGLEKPTCRQCTISEIDCSYGSLNVRWATSRARDGSLNVPSTFLNQCHPGWYLATNERRALDYFRNRLWPLLSTLAKPCPPPLALALHSKPVLQAACIFAESHRALEDPESRHTLVNGRLRCLTTIRKSLARVEADHFSLNALLVAVLLLYLLDGYVDCAKEYASTREHHAGVLAIIETLGGFENIRASASTEVCMLLSEFASTDLTGALLHGKMPHLDPWMWDRMESRPVWWENSASETSLASIFRIMATMCFYGHTSSDDIAMDHLIAFEQSLQPTFMCLAARNGNSPAFETNDHAPLSACSQSLLRAFQHSALIYLYRKLCGLASDHRLVQVHVHACLESVRGTLIDSASNAFNCAIFPLYVAGAHALAKAHREKVFQILDIIYANNKFDAVLSIRANLNLLWENNLQSGSWAETFQTIPRTTLVL